MIVFGGFKNGEITNTLVVYDFLKKKWKLTNDKGNKIIPCERAGHSACIYNQKIYIFCGADKDGVRLNDFWVYDIKKNVWE